MTDDIKKSVFSTFDRDHEGVGQHAEASAGTVFREKCSERVKHAAGRQQQLCYQMLEQPHLVHRGLWLTELLLCSDTSRPPDGAAVADTLSRELSLHVLPPRHRVRDRTKVSVQSKATSFTHMSC